MAGWRIAHSSGVVGSADRTAVSPEDLRTADVSLGGVGLPLLPPARVYVCGITPYDVTHLGHAATFVWADAAAAVWSMAGVDVLSARNVTDVDDVLTHAAATRGAHYDDFALGQEYLFESDMAALGVRKPTHAPRARHYVHAVIALAAALLRADRAYEKDGHIYFRGADVPAAAGLDRDEALRRSAEFGDDPEDALRENPFDVAVWRPSAESDPAWPSPWGWGRPGWHAECAAMAHATLGGAVDVLAGGADLAFPHHAYQAAMVEAATGVAPFARARMHVGTVHVNGAKMAKSTGNLVLVADLLERHSAHAVRLLVLNRPWADPWEYRPADLDASAALLDRLYRAAGTPAGSDAGPQQVVSALMSNLDVPQACAIALDAGGDAARLFLSTLRLT